MSTHSARVCVVGAGLAGLACGFAMAEAGLQVEVFHAETSAPPADAPVNVVPNMMRAIAALGLADECVRSGFPYRRTSFLARDGRPLFAIEAQQLAGRRHPAALGISRHALHRLLTDACLAAGVHFHWNARVEGVETLRDGALLRLSDREVPADLVLLACGARAKLREAVFGPQKVGHAIVWTHLLAPRPPRIDEALFAAGVRGQKTHVVPISATQLGLTLYGATAHENMSHLLAGLPGPLAQLASLSHSQPVERRVPLGWVDDSQHAAIVAVGECACGLAPHFGQPAAQALEDAVVLAELLHRFSVADVVQPFRDRRVPRRLQVMEITSQAARWAAAPEPQTDFRSLADALASVLAPPA